MTLDELNAKIAEKFEIVTDLEAADLIDAHVLYRNTFTKTADEIWGDLSNLEYAKKLFWRVPPTQLEDGFIHCRCYAWPWLQCDEEING